MKRIHLFEFLDLAWYPQTLRRIQTDYLQFSTTLGGSRGSGTKTLIPLFKKAMQNAKTTEIVDLCSGGTGSWIGIQEELRQAGLAVSIKLTDKFPNPKALQTWPEMARQGIEYLVEPVDAMNVPDHLMGMRTLFAGFHHFKSEQAKSILNDAFEKKAAIGIFEPSLKPPFGFFLLLLAPITVLLSYLFMTPFIKPHTLSRFFWTYLVPIAPFVTCWDGVISMLRVYSPDELKELTNSLQRNDYIWEIGQASLGIPVMKMTYLLGYPVIES
jgi:hypothetical protein